MNKTKLLIAPLLVVPFLASCGGGDKPGPEPSIYHTIEFKGTNCEMHDEEEKSVITKQFEAGQTASYHLVGSTDEFDIPLAENVVITYTETGKPFDGTYSYNQTDGSLSVKMTADVTITAHSEESTNTTVTEIEYEAALAFTDVEYLQIKTKMNMTEIMEGTEIEQISPTTHYDCQNYTGFAPFTLEKYVYELDEDTHKKISRESSATSWEDVSWEDTDEQDWVTPQIAGKNIKDSLTKAGVKGFKSFTYNPATKSYICIPTSGYNIILKFEDKKLVYMNTADSMEVTFEYEIITPELPIAPPEPADPTVTKAEFEAALAFTGVEYLQNESLNVPTGITYELKECSSNIYHYIAEYDGASSYYEAYVYKFGDGAYKKISRESTTTSWEDVSWEDAAEPDDWEDPQDVGKGINDLLTQMEVEDFDPSKYDPETKSYILKTKSDMDVTFKFKDKKLAHLDLGNNNEMSFTYKQETPELPVDPPVNPIVTSEEYDAALAFTGVKYLQVETLVNQPGVEVGTKNETISPSVYHSVADFTEDMSTHQPSYFEGYIYKINKDLCKSIVRMDKTTSWLGITWEDTQAQNFVTPQKKGKSIREELSDAGVIGFESFTYESATESYVYNADQNLDITLKFANKKLVYMDIAGTISTFEYEKITPVTPIDPPIEPLESYTFKFYEHDETTEFTTMTIVVDETSEYYSLIFPQHGADEGGWYCKELYGQIFNPGETVQIPAKTLSDYSFVWKPSTL